MTTLVSDKFHLFTGLRDIPNDKHQACHFLEKTYFQFLRRGQKLAVILENNVIQNLKLEKKMLKVFIQNWSPKLTFLNEKNQKDSIEFDIEN